MKILKAGEYYGQKKSANDFTGVLLSEYDYLSARTDRHFHENPYFMYVLAGNLYDVSQRAKVPCHAGSLIFHNWQEAHYNTKETRYARGFHLEFPRAWFDRQKLDIDLWEGSRLVDHPQLHHLLGKIYLEFKRNDSFTALSVELLLLQLCESTQKLEFHFRHEPAWVASLRQLLREGAEGLTLKSLSAQLDVHPVHISRAVPKYFGSSLGDYLRQQKVKQALRYVLDGSLSLTEIAHRCGFSDQSHFTRTFKAYLGRTPSAFRQQVG